MWTEQTKLLLITAFSVGIYLLYHIYIYTKSKNYLKRLYRIRHWIPMFIGTPCITYVGSNNLSLKYQRFTLKGCNVIGIRNYGFVAKVHLNSFNQFYLRSSQHFLYSSSIGGVIIGKCKILILNPIFFCLTWGGC